jgi:hypothetical protein
LRATWTPGNMALRGACSVRGVRLRSSGGKVQGALSAVLSEADAFRAACCWSPLARELRRGGERISRRGVTRADGERLLCEIELPGPVVGELMGAG